MNTAETLIIWFLVGTFAFFMVGLSWTGSWFFDLIRSKNKETASEGSIERDNFSDEHNGRINRSLIARFDLIEQLLGVAKKDGEENMIDQLKIMRKDFLFMLQEFSLEPYSYNIGDKITIEDRKRIILVDQKDGSNEVSENIAIGFTYQPEETEEPQIVRKAAVKLGV